MINLVYKKMGYNFEISKYSSLSYIFEVSSKVFKIPIKDIKLYFKNLLVPNDESNALEYFKKFPIIIQVINISNCRTISKQILKQIELNKKALRLQKEKIKENKIKHRIYVDCQICKKKNSIIFCRKCNLFICFECKVRYPEHSKHEQINVESGDFISYFNLYKNTIIEQLNEINKAYVYSLENVFNNQQIKDNFQIIYNSIEELDKKTETLNLKKPEYKCGSEILKEYNKYLVEIQTPLTKDEVVSSFTEVFEKENEIKGFISSVSLQIIKSKYNNKLEKFFGKINKLLNNMIKEINNKLQDSLSEFNIENIKEYNKKIVNKKNNLHSSDSEFNSIEKNKEDSNKTENNNKTLIINEIPKINNKYDDINNMLKKLNTHISTKNLKNQLELNDNSINNTKFLSEEKRYKDKSRNYFRNNNKSISLSKSKFYQENSIILPFLEKEKDLNNSKQNTISNINTSINKKYIESINENPYNNKISNIIKYKKSKKKSDLLKLKMNKKLLDEINDESFNLEKNTINPYVAEISQINRSSKKFW